MTAVLLKSCDAVVTCDVNHTVHRDADVLIVGPEIKLIGRTLPTSELPQDTHTIDARGHAVYPGLINTHHHFFQCFVRNHAHLDWTKLSVIEWLDRIYPLFSSLDEDSFYHASVAAIGELIKHGCTTAFDHQYNFPRHAGKRIIDRQFEAAELFGMRFHAGRGTNTLPRSAGSTIPDEMLESTEEFIADCESLIDTYHDIERFSMRQVAVAPCQPVNAHRETFTEAIALARDKGVLLHSHVGEGESELLRQRTGLRTVDWCEDIGFLGSDVWLAHCWELTTSEIQTLAATKTGVSHCPEPVYLVGAEVTPVSQMQAAGVRIGLGVDGAASNDNSNLMHCIHSAYMLQALVASTHEHEVPDPGTFLNYATRGGADLLQRPGLGTLEPGKAADLFMLDTRRLEYVGALHNPESLIGKLGVFSPVDLTMINGRIVWQDGEFPGLDEAQLAADAQAHVERVVYPNL
jgi:hydroxyatrazine ethylaminohydrolase